MKQFNYLKLTDYERNNVAIRNGYANSVPCNLIFNANCVLSALEEVQALHPSRIFIVRGFCSPVVSRLSGFKHDNMYVKALAADITSVNLDLLFADCQKLKYLKNVRLYKQLGYVHLEINLRYINLLKL